MKWFIEFESADKTYWHRFNYGFCDFHKADDEAAKLKKLYGMNTRVTWEDQKACGDVELEKANV